MTELPIVIDIKRETDLAWCAGFFEGEGYVGMNWIRGWRNGLYYERPRWRIMIGQSSNDGVPEVLTRFKSIMNVGQLYNIKPTKAHWKPLYRFEVTNRQDIEKVLKQIWPYLGEVKRQQAINAGFKIDG